MCEGSCCFTFLVHSMMFRLENFSYSRPKNLFMSCWMRAIVIRLTGSPATLAITSAILPDPSRITHGVPFSKALYIVWEKKNTSRKQFRNYRRSRETGEQWNNAGLTFRVPGPPLSTTHTVGMFTPLTKEQEVNICRKGGKCEIKSIPGSSHSTQEHNLFFNLGFWVFSLRCISPTGFSVQSQPHSVHECHHPPAGSVCGCCRGSTACPDPWYRFHSGLENNPKMRA